MFIEFRESIKHIGFSVYGEGICSLLEKHYSFLDEFHKKYEAIEESLKNKHKIEKQRLQEQEIALKQKKEIESKADYQKSSGLAWQEWNQLCIQNSQNILDLYDEQDKQELQNLQEFKSFVDEYKKEFYKLCAGFPLKDQKIDVLNKEFRTAERKLYNKCTREITKLNATGETPGLKLIKERSSWFMYWIDLHLLIRYYLSSVGTYSINYRYFTNTNGRTHTDNVTPN